VIAATRYLNPDARILVRARYLRERDELAKSGVAAAVFEEAEGAVALARLVLTDTGVHRQAAEEKVRDLRLQLIRENTSNIRSQRVRSVMVPWTRVRRLSEAFTRQEVLQQISEQRFSRWPVTDPHSGQVAGYLLSKDMIAVASANGGWTHLVRPLRVVHPDDSVESILLRMQDEGASVYAVEDGGSPVGLVTLEDILEQVVGRIEDEYPHESELSLRDALLAGKIVMELEGSTAEQVIAELSAAVPAERLPAGAQIERLAIARELEISTDLGVGVAIPHARIANLSQALVAFGRSAQGVSFSAQSSELVRLVFLLITPLEQPDLQLSLLSHLARIAGSSAARERLLQAVNEAEVIEVISQEWRG
jgi:mannitol/fructose-specific phosphotransferase system IIA component (Ntr-type)